jgi:hypothetical protein
MYSEAKLEKEMGSQSGIPVEYLCVSNGTTAQDYLKGEGIPADQDECFRRFADRTDVVVGVVTDLSILTTYAHQFGATAIPAVWRNDPSKYPVHDERYGIAMPDDNPALCRELTTSIDEFLADHDDGWDRAFSDHLQGVDDRDKHKPAHADPGLCGD